MNEELTRIQLAALERLRELDAEQPGRWRLPSEIYCYALTASFNAMVKKGLLQTTKNHYGESMYRIKAVNGTS